MIENKKKISIISEFIIFLTLILICIIILNNFAGKSNNINIAVDEEFEENTINDNEIYVRNIKQKYGIDIIFGDDSVDLVSSVDGNVQHNIYVINYNLKNIIKELEKYPEEVFDIFKSKKYPLKIVLLDYFNNNNLALTSKNSLNEYKIYLSNTTKYAKAFHHEMYHVLEYYMCDTNKYIYKSWYKLNPEGFNYSSDTELLNNEYVFMKLTDVSGIDVNIYETSQNPYFVTIYAKTTEREDRAETFSEMMIAKTKPKYLNEGQNILKKATYIDEAIKKCVTNQEFYYSKYIY